MVFGFDGTDAKVAGISYKEIVTAYPTCASIDTLILHHKKIMHYDGASAIKKKAELAAKKAGGVMIRVAC